MERSCTHQFTTKVATSARRSRLKQATWNSVLTSHMVDKVLSIWISFCFPGAVVGGGLEDEWAGLQQVFQYEMLASEAVA